MVRYLVFSCVILIGTLFGADSPAYGDNVFVRSVEDFNVHIESHRERVVQLGLALYDRYPEHFSEIPRDDVENALRLHDLAKTDDFFNRSLFNYYGVTLSELNDDGKASFKSLIDAINAKDRDITQSYFEDRHFLSEDGEMNEQGYWLDKILLVSDLVDRSRDPVAEEEFGRRMTPASSFLNDPTLRIMAEFLEGNYLEITQGHHPLSESCREHLKQVHAIR